jgi:hypothetical protein
MRPLRRRYSDTTRREKDHRRSNRYDRLLHSRLDVAAPSRVVGGLAQRWGCANNDDRLLRAPMAKPSVPGRYVKRREDGSGAGTANTLSEERRS